MSDIVPLSNAETVGGEIPPMPAEPSGPRCRKCAGALWRWEAGPSYPITVCDRCLEVTLPPFAMLFDSGKQYLDRAEELRAMLAARRIEGAAALLTSQQPADCASTDQGLGCAPGASHRSPPAITSP